MAKKKQINYTSLITNILIVTILISFACLIYIWDSRDSYIVKYNQNQKIINQIEYDNNKHTTDSIMRLNSKLDPSFVLLLQDAINKYSVEYDLPPEFIVSVIFRESSFKSTTTSTANCLGLMQINPKAHQDKIKKMGITRDEIFYIDNNIHLGCWILRDYINKTKSVDKALKRYVGGNLQKYVNDVLRIYSNLMINVGDKDE